MVVAMSQAPPRNLRTLVAGATISGLGLAIAVLGHFVFEIMPMTVAGVVLAVIGFVLELRALFGRTGRAATSKYVTQQVPETIDPSSPGATGEHGQGAATVSPDNPTDPDAYKKL